MVFVTAAHVFFFSRLAVMDFLCRLKFYLSLDILLFSHNPQDRLLEVSQERKSFDDLGGRGVLER
jgi:hypothetical protein